MSKIILGRSQEGKVIEIDLKTLLRTRLLVQAASGGGKSRTLRRLAEQFFGKVPVWIVDKEDEFPSLRDKFGYIFSGPGGETPTDPRSAELVCERLLKAKASAIFGLYSLKDPMRHEWVKIFLNALMNAPKSLWTPLIVMVDESHKFCPEKGQGESVAKDAMTDLAVDGRKRGFCAGYFTQRLGKLSKNASAELINRMVGKTVEDIDVDRAVELMSVRRTDREEFEHGIKRLPPGNFWCFGDAISTDRVLVQVGECKTKHPEPGEPSLSTLPPLPEKMRKLLPQLADLPKEAEQKAKTESELKKENQNLRAQIATLGRQLQSTLRLQTFTKPEVKTLVETKIVTEVKTRKLRVIQDAEIRAVEAVIKRLEKIHKQFEPLVDKVDKRLENWVGTLSKDLALAVEAAQKVDGKLAELTPNLPFKRKDPQPSDPPFSLQLGRKGGKVVVGMAPPLADHFPKATEDACDGALSDLQLRQLTGLHDFEKIGIEKVERPWLSGWLGMSLSGHFKNSFYALQKRGLIAYAGSLLLLTDDGRRQAPASDLDITNKAVLDRCVSAVEDLSGRQLRYLHSIYPEFIAREDLAAALEMSLSGHFKNCFYDLHKAGMIEYGTGEDKMKLRCAEWLFVEQVAVS